MSVHAPAIFARQNIVTTVLHSPGRHWRAALVALRYRGWRISLRGVKKNVP